MAAVRNPALLYVMTLSVFWSISAEFVDFNSPIPLIEDVLSCNQAGTSAKYFDVSWLECLDCPQDKTYQTVLDGFNCVCNRGYYYTKNFGGGSVNCTACPAGQVASSTGYECVACPANAPYNNNTGTCGVCQPESSQTIGPELTLLGVPYTDGSARNTKSCQTCDVKSQASADRTRCERCTTVLPITENQDCTCTDPGQEQIGMYCFPSSSLSDVDFGQPSYTLERTLESNFFQKNIQIVYAMCKPPFDNATACQVLGNMCVLMFYEHSINSLSGQISTACNMFFKFLVDERTFAPRNLPWLAYVESDGQPAPGDEILKDTYLQVQYTFDPVSRLEYRVVKYSLDGTYQGRSGVENGVLQLCSDATQKLNAAYVFGTTYSQSCQIAAINLWDQRKYPLEFFDIYLEITQNGEPELYPIPVSILNYVSLDNGNNEVNRGGDMQSWELFRRFFLVDNVATIAPSDPTGPAQVVRYAKSISIHVSLQDDTNLGVIYAPYLKIDYGTVTRADAEAGSNVDISFSVEYSYSDSTYRRDFQIAVGTLSTLGVIYAGYRSWVWSKRSGRLQIDFPTIVNFFFFVAGSLANVFFAISFGMAFYWLVFFKRQSVVYLLHPAGSALEDWLGLFAAAFALKALQIIHMIFMQCTVDVFFIDWERSRGTTGGNAEGSKAREVPVSIWRTYFCANEWNELQAVRKINKVFQVFAVVFFLVVVGFENVATVDPDGSVNKSNDQYQSAHSNIFRYGVAVIVYLVVGIVQWIFFTFIYERFLEDKVRQFVDLCSMSNISVFVMANAQYGHYIHGRSVHGKSDTNMREMFEMMKKEEEDMCGQRGLLPNTEQQTFIMSLPRKLRLKYEQVLLPAQLEGAAAGTRLDQGRGGSRISGTATEKQVEAYSTINRFFSAFIDHSLRDLDYVVKDKTFLESIMDTEFYDASETGIFYNDDGHSFDQVLFYGNEMTLLVFDTLLFCIVDLIFTNFVVAGVVTYIIIELVSMARNAGGQKNLAKKTLVDERFLI